MRIGRSWMTRQQIQDITSFRLNRPADKFCENLLLKSVKIRPDRPIVSKPLPMTKSLLSGKNLLLLLKAIVQF